MKNNNKTLFYIVLGLGIYAVLYAYKQVFGPLIIGALLAYLLYPPVIILKTKTKLSHTQSTIIVFSLFIIFLLTIATFSAPALVRQFQSLEGELEKVSQEIIKLQPGLGRVVGFNIPVNEVVTSLNEELTQFLQPERLFRVILSATTNIVWVLVIFVECFFLLKDWESLKLWFYQLFPKTMQKKVITIHEDIKIVWQTYLRGQLLMMLLIGSLSAIGGLAVGLWGALLIGILAGGLALIPNIGPAMATAIAGVIAWTKGSSYLDISNFWFAILVCGIYLFIQFLEGIWFQPRIMSKRMMLHPGLIIIFILSTISLLGVLAGLIVIPVIGSLGVIYNHLQEDGKRESARKKIPN